MLGIATGFLLLYWWFEVPWLLYVAIGVSLTGLFIKPLARLIEKGWMLLAKAIGYVNSRIILGLIFFVVLYPIALLSRIGKRDPLGLRGGKDSLFKTRDHQYSKEDMENPW
ncbi:MAG: hypothetical protein GYB31_12425 [Bacteroidetes bacterium]|nr:hypothetical protein [Bacteroidota bacterium]